ncbi:hypothetical protein BJ546DRAFT_1015605 [Cryomyces antarcticus]
MPTTLSKGGSTLLDVWDKRDDRVAPDVFIKAFNDLDLLIYRGQLHGRVYLEWTRAGEMHGVRGQTVLPHHRHERIVIQLDPRSLQEDWKLAWAILIHEMLHAYLFVTCGSDYEPCPVTGDRYHGPMFRRTLETIRSEFGFDKGQLNCRTQEMAAEWEKRCGVSVGSYGEDDVGINDSHYEGTDFHG